MTETAESPESCCGTLTVKTAIIDTLPIFEDVLILSNSPSLTFEVQHLLAATGMIVYIGHADNFLQEALARNFENDFPLMLSLLFSLKQTSSVAAPCDLCFGIFLNILKEGPPSELPSLLCMGCLFCFLPSDEQGVLVLFFSLVLFREEITFFSSASVISLCLFMLIQTSSFHVYLLPQHD